MQLELLSCVGDDVRAAGEFVGRGTHDGTLHAPTGAIPATGRELSAPFVWYAEVADGKITRLGDYYNAATLMSQLGLMPDPGWSSA
jgi:ketosteroid isomerase-like protein